jgi:hypothetical protein
LRREILRVANITNFSDFPIEAWASHPTLRWAAMAIQNAIVDMLIPNTLIESVGAYADVTTVDYGNTATYDVEPRDLFVVSKAGNGKRITEVKKQFKGQVVVNPIPYELTVGVSFYRVLAGKENLATFLMKVARSLETAFTYDIYSTFATAMNALDATATTGLRVAGFTQADFVSLAQKVSSYNGGSKAIAMGTLNALANVLPADANYKYSLDDSYAKLGYIPVLSGVDLMVIPQVADFETPFQGKIADNRIWIVSPGTNKLVKAVLEGSLLSYVSDVNANANLVQTATMTKRFASAVATNSIAAVITL